MPGPIPNRSEDLARPRERGQGESAPVITKGELLPVKVPNANRDWHPSAQRIWDSMKVSGQAAFYQQTDWAMAHFLMGEISDYLNTSKKSSMMLASLMQALTGLCLTEGERRRARIELEAPKEESDASITAIDAYKKGLGLV